MILSFSKYEFCLKILSGEKKHTIRADENFRWRHGTKVHFWYGSARNKKTAEGKTPFPFFPEVAGKNPQATSIHGIRIFRKISKPDEIVISLVLETLSGGGIILSPEAVEQLIQNDGLTREEFVQWFCKEPGQIYTGRLIQWLPEPLDYFTI